MSRTADNEEINYDNAIPEGDGASEPTTPDQPSRNFLNAVFANTDDDVLGFHGDSTPVVINPQILKDYAGKLRVSPVTASGLVSCVFHAVKDDDGHAWKDSKVPPTTVLHKDGLSLVFYTFDVPALPEHAARLAAKFGMESVREFFPLPGTDGWELVHCDPDVTTTLSKLEDAYCGTRYAVGEMYYGALVETPFDEADHINDVVLTLGTHKESKNWSPKTMPRFVGIKQFCDHKVGKKDGPGAVLGDMIAGERRKAGVKKLYWLGIDDDSGTPIEENKEKIRKSGYTGVLYTTHSNAKVETDIVKDRIIKFGGEVTPDLIKRFMLEVEHWHPSMVESITGFREEFTKSGPKIFIQHQPMPKTRFIAPLEAPFDVAAVGKTHAEGMAMWGEVCEAAAKKIGMTFDKSCTDPSRIFYPPRHTEGAPFGIWLYGGKCVDASEFTQDDPLEDFVKQAAKGRSKSVTPEGKALGKWSMKRAHGFQIADVIEDNCPEKIRGKATQGFDIECPFDENHGNAGDPDDRACFVVNATEGSSEFFTISCRHESCRKYTNLDMLGKMLKDGWFV